jgi:protein-tyrosine-phosphatase
MARVLCVCTGNTCRSPMLAALLAAQLKLERRADLQVESAGTNAVEGDGATPAAVRTLGKRGIDLAAHRSRDISRLGVADYDRFLCMTTGHAAFIRSLGVQPQRIEVVNAEHGGVPDPFGGSDHDYEATAQVLERFAAEAAKRLGAAT